jgi:hypothetical protein
MRNYLLLLFSFLSLGAGAQLTVGDGSLTLAAGTALQLENGLALLPAEDLTITNNRFSQSTTPVSLNATVSSIQHVVSLTNPLVFTGTVRLFYNPAGLNGYNETDLKLSYQTGTNWSPSLTSIVNTTDLCVDEVVTAKTFTALTASAVYVPLPVTLVSFSARRQDGHTVLLQWQTAGESNNSHFTVERSSDGRNFTTIGRVAAAASSGAVYTFTDAQPFSGNNYYRLRQHDHDGSQRLYGVRLVPGNRAAGGALLYPNPVTGESLTIDVKREISQPLAYTINNAAGQVVRTGQLTSRQQVLSIGKLPAGTYHLQLGDGQTLNFLKR